MRFKAVLLAILAPTALLALAAPAQAAKDECVLPCVPVSGGGDTYYVFPGNANCPRTPHQSTCTGGHAAPVVYRENGSCAGLQTGHTALCLRDDVVAS